MIRVWIERQDGLTFCGVVRRADGAALRWIVELGAPTRTISFCPGTHFPFPGPWVRPTTDAICLAIDKVLAGCERRQFTVFA